MKQLVFPCGATHPRADSPPIPTIRTHVCENGCWEFGVGGVCRHSQEAFCRAGPRGVSRADQKFPARAEQKGTTSGEGKADKTHDMGAAVA